MHSTVTKFFVRMKHGLTFPWWAVQCTVATSGSGARRYNTCTTETVVPTSTYLRNNKRFISSSRWILAVVEFEPSARRWVGGARLLPLTCSVPMTPSLIRYPATAERTAHLVLPFSFLCFRCFSVRSLDYFLADLDSGRLHGIQHKCYPFLSFPS